MQWLTPASRKSRRRACRSEDSGVVRGAAADQPGRRYSIVPMSPGAAPAARRISSRMKVVVVLPLVPVTPTTFIRSEGWP